MVGKPIVSFLPSVIEYLDRLGKCLFYSGYFSFHENAISYVNTIVRYISKNIHLLPSKVAPLYFSKYGKNLLYIMYRPNRTTTWYIFFQKQGNHYLICHITNNHIEGHYIR